MITALGCPARFSGCACAICSSLYGARVLGLRVVVEIEPPALVDGDVLEDRSKCPRRLVDLGLGFDGKRRITFA
jgi:hypothetical protein